MSANKELNNRPQWEDPTPRSNKTGKRLFIGLLALLLVGAMSIGVFASGRVASLIGGSPQDRVTAALISLFKGADNPFMEDWIGNKELQTNYMNTGSKVNGYLELVDSPYVRDTMGTEIPTGVMLSMETINDMTNKATSGKFAAGMMGSEIVNLHFFTNEAKMQAASPALFTELITADMTGDLEAKLKASPLFGEEMNNPETAAAVRQMIESIRTSGKQQDLMKRIMSGQAWTDYMGLVTPTVNFKNKWVVTDAQPKAMTFNGAQGNFEGYEVTIRKADYLAYARELKTYMTTDARFRTDFMDSIMSQIAAQEKVTLEEAYQKFDTAFNETMTQAEADPNVKDITFVVHMTQDNMLVSLSTGYQVENDAVNMNYERYGGAYANENMKMTFDVTGDEPGKIEVTSTGTTDTVKQTRETKAVITGVDVDDIQDLPGVDDLDPSTEPDDDDDDAAQTMELTMTRTTSKDTGMDDILVNVTVPGEDDAQVQNLSAAIKGKYQDIVKGKSGTYVMDEMKLSLEDQVLAVIKGEWKYTSENVVAAELQGTPLDLFTATEEDMQKIMTQIQEKLGGIMSMFGGQQ